MLWTIAVILIVLWLLGLVSSYTMGGFIHNFAHHRNRCDIDQNHSGTKSFVDDGGLRRG